MIVDHTNNIMSNMDAFAPKVASIEIIDGMEVEELETPVQNLGRYESRNKATSAAGGMKGYGGAEDVGVIQHDLLICQPCDEVTEARKDTSSSGGGGAGVNGLVAERRQEDGGEVVDEMKYSCRIIGCDFKAKLKGTVKNHLAQVHEVNVKWYPCPEVGCDYKAKQRGNVKIHLADVHNIGTDTINIATDTIKEGWVTQEGWQYMAKKAENVKSHLSSIHDEIGVKWHHCPQQGCEYKAKERAEIKKHLAHIHDIGVTWYPCPESGCDFKSKTRASTKRHLANVHDIGVTWFPCPVEGCEYKAKERANVKAHFANVHDAGAKRRERQEDKYELNGKKEGVKSSVKEADVTWYPCPQEGCEYKSK